MKKQFNLLLLFATIILFNNTNLIAQTGDSCGTAVYIQSWLNSTADNLEMQNQTNWFYFNNDSNYVSFYIFKSDAVPNEGKVNHIEVYKGICDSLVLLFDTTIIHGTNNIKFGISNLTSGTIYLKLTNLDTTDCIPCINDYKLKLWLKNAQYNNITWPIPVQAFCPNIINNPGFEDITGASICQGIGTFLNNWNEIDSPDWFSIGNTGCSSSSIPTSTWFTTIPNPPSPSITAPNNSYIGVATAVWQNNTTWNTGWTEIAMQDLPTTLTLNKRYLVRTKVALAANTRFTSNNMNIRVGNDNTYGNAPQISAPMLTNPNTWLQLENSFLSDGTENKIFIGNNMINSNGMNTLISVINASSANALAYYFADDIELYRLADAGPDVTISHCTPAQIGTCMIPGANYLWTPSTGLSSATDAQPFAMPTQTTQYIVRVIYQLMNGNTAIDYDTVTVTVPPCNCFANAGQDITILDCTPKEIGPDCINPNLTYEWSPIDGLSDPNSPNPLALPITNTTYILTVYYTDQFGYTFIDYDTVNVYINTQACVSTITPHTISPIIYANNLGNALYTNTNYAIDGTVYVNVPNFTIADIDLVLGPNTKFVIFPGCDLIITNSYLHGCCAMWHGIKVGQNATVYMNNNTVIEDADTAITVRNNGSYQLYNTVFNKNYIDVVAIGTPSINQLVFVNNCTFDCNDTQMPGTYTPYGLRPPMLGLRSAIAISANDVNPLIIGSNATNANFFFNHDYGLWIKNVELTANYNIFKNIDDNSINQYSFNTPKGYAIHCENTNNGNYLANINNNQMSDGVTGISAWKGYRGHFVDNNIKTMSQFGIVFVENKKRDFRIFFNTIDNVGWVGIYGLNNYNTSIGIHGNILHNSFNKLYRTAIGVDENIVATVPGLVQINKNHIDNYEYGITTTRLINPYIYSNIIQIQPMPWGLYAHGIRMFENMRALVYGNTIFGNNRDEYFVDGIRSDNGNAADLQCNYTVKTGSGAFFSGASIIQGRVKSNIFLKDFWGVVIANQARIQNQGDPLNNISNANQWIGSMGNPDYAHTLAYGANGNLSPFYTLTGYPWQPIVNDVGGFSFIPVSWTPVSNNLNDNCTQYRTDLDTALFIIAPGGGGIDETELLMQINNTNFEANIAESAWWAKSSAYSELKLHDELNLQNSDLLEFKDSVDMATLGRFTEIDKSLNDTLGTNIDSLKGQNSAISTNNVIEELIKSINAIKLDFKKYQVLSESQLNSLRLIAAMCPHTEGPAIYTARALLRGLDQNRMEYMNECEKVYPESNSNRQSNLISNAVDNKLSDFTVLPNPASNSIILNHNGNYNYIQIEEINGKIVFNATLNSNIRSEILDVSNLASGIYILSMKSINATSKIKLIINK